MSQRDAFSVVIATHNEGDWLQKTVDAVLSASDVPHLEVVVVADGCTDGSTAFLEDAAHPGVRLVTLPESLGAPQARNAGAAVASGEYLVFVDSHVKPDHPGWLSELADQLSVPGVGAATLNVSSLGKSQRNCFVYTVKTPFLGPAWVDPVGDGDWMSVPVIPGTCFAVTREVFSATGGFDEGLRKWGREDFEYSLRLWRLGYDLSMSRRYSIAHKFKFNVLGQADRSFVVEWSQLVYNTLRTVVTLFPDDWVRVAVEYVRPKLPSEVAAALEDLSSDEGFEQRKRVLDQAFVRSFDDYVAHFGRLLPLGRFAPGTADRRHES